MRRACARASAFARGDPIGTVGSTGNANPAGPHLHFAIHRMAPGERWYQGRPVNPYPLLAGSGAAPLKRPPTLSNPASSP